MMSNLRSLYGLRYASIIVYMLQSTEYQIVPYLQWYWRTSNFSNVMYRRELAATRAAELLKLTLRLGIILQILAGILLIVLWRLDSLAAGLYFGLALIISYPIIWAHLVTVPLFLGRWLIVAPREERMIAESEKIFKNHPGVKIAVAGSYGKTTMKELLNTVLSESKNVAATPANKNVAISHARFAAKLKGDEDILIIEFGEGKPGDVANFAKTTHPNYGIITGLAPAHLDKYKTLAVAGKDIFSLASYLSGKNIFANAESPAAKPFIKKHDGIETYSESGALGWKTGGVNFQPDGTDFSLTKGKKSLKLASGLLGKHQLGPLSLSAALALELGLTEKQVEAGVARARPFEHRMQPYKLNGGWVIDDTYNGNIEGVRVGTELLKTLKAKRKIYVTPGLVDQGQDTAKIHEEVGGLIAQAQPDLVVLMQNSAEPFIKKGLKDAEFTGKIRTEVDPLNFYTNLNHFVATGDIILMQNDWTDNYA